MLEFLKEFEGEEYDAIFFLPGEKPGHLHLEGSKYRIAGDKLNTSDFGLGDMYHIIIFKEDDKGNVKNFDSFEGILGSPLEYISVMIKMNWFGVVCKKTTTSLDFVGKIVDNMV